MIIYNLVILLYGLVIKLASINNPKAKLWVKGRKNWRKNLSEKINPISKAKKVWVHCASLGEFEQGRPLIEAIKKQHPDYKIILTFFSPSGYEVTKNYEGADLISYLPLDTRLNARDFLEIVKPDLAVFIKYEFWINFLRELQRLKIKSYLVSAVFKAHHPFFKWYGGIFRRSLQCFKILFVQDNKSAQLLESISYNNIEVCGDTRFDRVLEIKNSFKPIPEIEEFKGKSKLIVAGSTWPEDENLVINVYTKLKDEHIKLVIAPHEIDKKFTDETIAKLQKQNLNFCLFTEGIRSDCNILILNTIGLLSRTYSYADAAYVGGGFNDGIHNILEPAVYGIPVLFSGSDFSKYNEAVELVQNGAAFTVLNDDEFARIWHKFSQNEKLSGQLKRDLDSYFTRNGNVTAKLLKSMELG